MLKATGRENLLDELNKDTDSGTFNAEKLLNCHEEEPAVIMLAKCFAFLHWTQQWWHNASRVCDFKSRTGILQAKELWHVTQQTVWQRVSCSAASPFLHRHLFGSLFPCVNHLYRMCWGIVEQHSCVKQGKQLTVSQVCITSRRLTN